MEKINCKRVSFKTLFKLLFIGFSFTMVPFSVIFAILGFLGVADVTFNGHQIQTITDVAFFILSGAAVALILSVLIWLILVIGLGIYSIFSDKFEAECVE